MTLKTLKSELLADPKALERGQQMPSMRTVQRYASATGAPAVVRLEMKAAGRWNKKAAA